ncbi:MAG: plastocyanin/azurin family copper-binding protein [Acidimicrobiia bacterium]|jgi:plastocyanin
MRRRLHCTALVAGVLVTAAALTACGGDDDDGGGESVTVTNGQVTVEARDTAFDYTEIDTTPGDLEVTLVEAGSLDHTFVVEDAEGNAIEPKLTVGGGTDRDSGTYALQPGDYEYFCDIPGHRGQGMEGTLVVQ